MPTKIPGIMKQYKLIIKENCTESLSGILASQAKNGWKLNSYESSASPSVHRQHTVKQRVVFVFEK